MSLPRQLSPAAFLAAVQAGCQVSPNDEVRDDGTAENLGVFIQVGSRLYQVDWAGLPPDTLLHFAQLYDAGQVEFGFPGDFKAKPPFITQRRTVLAKPVGTGWVDSWIYACL